jgi:hypothetical protein
LAMIEKYQKLITLDLVHEYYDFGSLPDLIFSPIPSTAKRLTNHRILSKQIGSSLVLLYEGRVSADQWEPVVQLEGEQQLVFGLKFNDALFQTKTAVAFHTSKTQKLIISLSSEGDYDSQNAMKLTSFVKGDLVLDNLKGEAPITYSIKDKNNAFVFEQQVKAFGQELAPIENSGVFTLYKDGELVKEFFWNPFDSNFDAFLVVDIKNTIDQHFKFSFLSKSIFWKYFLHAKYTTDIEQFEIKEETDQLTFEKDEELDEGKLTSLELISTEKIKLKEKYTYNLSISEGEEKIKQHISFPKLSNIGRCSKDVNKFLLITHLNL